MTEKPSYVQDFDRPAGTEIKHINGHWYLYERKGVYDPKTKKCHKVSGRIIGTITPEGLIPSRRNSPLQKTEELEIENREYGASFFLYTLSENIRQKLQNLFPDCWREIYAMAMMKCKENSPYKRMSFHYCTSWLEQILGPLGLSEGRISQILKRIGTDRKSICSYMRDDLPDGSVLLFDGHRIISASGTMENALVGYDSRCRYLPQINLAYMFNGLGGEHFPSYYKQFAGNVPDVTTFADTIEEAGLKKNSAVIVGDKGCGSELNEELLEDAGLGYILALRRGCGENIEPPQSIAEYDKSFAYQERAILCKEIPGDKYNTYLYYDMCLANNEALDIILRHEKANTVIEKKRAIEDRRRQKGTGRMSMEEYNSLKPRDVTQTLHSHTFKGTFTLRTNCKNFNCLQTYISYKARTDIEQAFKFYDNELSGAASYMQNQNSFEGWLFINHLTLQMLYNVINLISRMELTNKYSFEDLLAYLKHVHMNKINGKWKMTKITKKTSALCQSLNINLNP